MEELEIITALFWIAWIASALWAADLARAKGLGFYGPFLMTLVFGPIGWLYIIGMPISPQRAAERELYIRSFVEGAMNDTADRAADL